MRILESLYKKYYGRNPELVIELAGAGSGRRYFRLSSQSSSAVGVLGMDNRENRAFIELAEAFKLGGAPVPAVYEAADDFSSYLQEDLGGSQLLGMLNTDEAQNLVTQVMRRLPTLQLCEEVKDEMLYPVKRMERRHVLADLHYFKYCFLKAAGIEPNEDKLEREFEQIARLVEATPPSLCGLILRDCQSRNVMVKNGMTYFIDFQSARRGPLLYDVASFLWQARAGFAPSFRREMVNEYLDSLEKFRDFDRNQALDSLDLMVLIRTLQVLGAYGLRGLTQRKAHFLESLPSAQKNVKAWLDPGKFGEFAELRRCLSLFANQQRFESTTKPEILTVTIYSFSYKKGYPDDFSGNGGGFMFDCRAMHNPGRYDRYKPLTGRDKEVIDFLEQKGEVQEFLKGVSAIVMPAIGRYVERGFTSLQVGFGCTGGRHRSVYCAENFARYVREKFPGDQVRIRLIHREQGIKEDIK